MSTPQTVSSNNLGARHIRFGWWALFVFAALGVVLESLHGFRIGWYLDVTNDARRLMLTLGHAHGTLLGVINIVFGLTATQNAQIPSAASMSLRAATVALPGGFILGGIVIYGSDPGLGVLLVPVGAILLLVALVMVAQSMKD